MFWRSRTPEGKSSRLLLQMKTRSGGGGKVPGGGLNTAPGPVCLVSMGTLIVEVHFSPQKSLLHHFLIENLTQTKMADVSPGTSGAILFWFQAAWK